MIGRRLGPYEVLAKLGEGGMGEVYRATDTNLKRAVAIKVLPASVASDAERIARFQREAEVLAALNHPNIAQIHGLEKSDGTIALVMELVEGPTLADRIAQGAIPVEEAIAIAKQIAQALEAAHGQGIIHRDLKPANVKVRADGAVKVLDFGLAKALGADAASATAGSNSMMPTITTPAMTQVGMILGTAAYMSPEQAKGRAVDKRADVWAFGCVLYEMLTGRRAFEGEDVSDTLAAVLRGEPDWSALPAPVPPTVKVYLRRCLERDPAQRVHDIADLRLALEGAFDVPAGEVAATPVPSAYKIRWRLMTVGAVVLTAAAAVLGALSAPIFFPGRPPSVVRLTATPLTGITPTGGDTDVAVSPDGSRLAYVNLEQDRPALYARSLGQLDAVRIESMGVVRSPFFSPDGQWIGFFDGTTLRRASSSGGPAVTIATFSGAARGGSWAADDTIVFATGEETGLLRVPAAGGEPTVLTKPEANQDHLFPEVLPGGRAVLFTIVARGQTVASAQIAILDLESGTHNVVLSGGSNGRYAASGHLLYGISGALRAVPFDLDTLTIHGNAVPVVEQVVTKNSGAADFAISSNGLLVYESGDSTTSERLLVWVDRQGREEPLAVPKRAYTYPRISPDGARIALDIRDQENDIWLWDVTRQTMTRLTFDTGLNRGIVWMPDGKRLAFSAERNGPESVFWQAADGSGSPERLTSGQAGRPQVPYSVTPDGSRLLFGEPGQAPYDLYQLELGTEGKVTPLLNASYSEHNAEVSPDGRWMAYQSNESGSDAVYVRPFPNINDGRWQISTGSGSRPAWARSGRELFYLATDGTMFVAPVERGGAGLKIGVAKPLFRGPYFRAQAARTYDVSPDGQRFLMIKNAVDEADQRPTELVAVLNFFEELKRLVPVP